MGPTEPPSMCLWPQPSKALYPGSDSQGTNGPSISAMATRPSKACPGLVAALCLRQSYCVGLSESETMGEGSGLVYLHLAGDCPAREQVETGEPWAVSGQVLGLPEPE